MSGALFGEAVTVLFVVFRAIAAWIAVAAAALTVCLFTAVLTGAWAWRAVRSRHTPASRPHGGSCGSRDTDTPPNPADARVRPSWARTEHDHQEAA